MTENKHIENELRKFNVSDAAIENLKQVYMPLTIKGIDDIEGYKAVNRARIDVKNLRISIEKSRKDLTADAVKVQRSINEEAKRITLLLTPIEDHLHQQEAAIDAEKERIKREKQDAERARIQAEQDRQRAETIARENAQRAAEEERLNKIREEQEAERQMLNEIAIAQAEKDAALKAETDRIEKLKQCLFSESSMPLEPPIPPFGKDDDSPSENPVPFACDVMRNVYIDKKTILTFAKKQGFTLTDQLLNNILIFIDNRIDNTILDCIDRAVCDALQAN